MRQDLKIASVEKIAFNIGYIDHECFLALARHLGKSKCGRYLERCQCTTLRAQWSIR